jgi:hypothetical protein
MRAIAFLILLAAGAAAFADNALSSGQNLSPGQALTSSNGRYQLRFEKSGRMALFRLPEEEPSDACSTCCAGLLWALMGSLPGPEEERLWTSSGARLEGEGKLHLQEDNNLVILDDDGTVAWESGTAERDPAGKASLVLQDDGRLCLQKEKEEDPLWVARAHPDPCGFTEAEQAFDSRRTLARGWMVLAGRLLED